MERLVKSVEKSSICVLVAASKEQSPAVFGACEIKIHLLLHVEHDSFVRQIEVDHEEGEGHVENKHKVQESHLENSLTRHILELEPPGGVENCF